MEMLFIKMVRYILMISTVMLLLACAPTVLPVNALQTQLVNNRPEWVSRKPNSGSYYIGVGYSHKSSSDNYVQSAKSNALDDMISEIKVNISSVSVLNQMDNSDGFTEKYESIIKTSTSDEIEDYELVDSWEDENQYWVYYKLSKSKYRKRKIEKRKNAIALAKDDYLIGRQQIKDGQVTIGIATCINGLYEMAPYLAQSNKTWIDGDSVLLGNSIYNEIQTAFNDIDISTTKQEYAVNRRLDKDEAIDIYIKTKSKRQPVSEMPLKAKFTVGSGGVHPDYLTNDQGLTTVLISSIKSREAKQVVTVLPDLERLANLDDTKKKYGVLLEGIKLPQKELYFQVKKPIVFIDAKESKLGIETNGTQITAKIKQLLSNEGFILGRIKDKADLWIEVLADTEKGKASGSIFITYFNLSINVIDMNTGAEVHHAGINKLKAYSLNYERSSQSGYDKAVEVLETKTLPELIEEILQ